MRHPLPAASRASALHVSKLASWSPTAVICPTATRHVCGGGACGWGSVRGGRGCGFEGGGSVPVRAKHGADAGWSVARARMHTRTAASFCWPIAAAATEDAICRCGRCSSCCSGARALAAAPLCTAEELMCLKKTLDEDRSIQFSPHAISLSDRFDGVVLLYVVVENGLLILFQCQCVWFGKVSPQPLCAALCGFRRRSGQGTGQCTGGLAALRLLLLVLLVMVFKMPTPMLQSAAGTVLKQTVSVAQRLTCSLLTCLKPAELDGCPRQQRLEHTTPCSCTHYTA